MFGRGLRTLSIASVVLVTGAFALVFLYAPNDADQGFVQKIFYLHVPLATAPPPPPPGASCRRPSLSPGLGRSWPAAAPWRAGWGRSSTCGPATAPTTC